MFNLLSLRKMAAECPVVKGWTVYRSIEEAIKNMSVVLPLVNDLHSSAMRDRHWKGVAKVRMPFNCNELFILFAATSHRKFIVFLSYSIY